MRGGLLAIPLALGVAGCVGASADEGTERAVEVFGPWRGEEADRFADVLAPFEEASGIEVQYVGSDDFVNDLFDRATDATNPPDIAMVPQQGVIDDLVADGRLLPLAEPTREEVVANFGDSGLDGADDDAVYAVPFRIDLKSLVWYRPAVFEAQGWQVPATMDELRTLADTIEADSDIAPWCFAVESGFASGWPATDWVEDLIARAEGTDVYDQWASGEIGFADPRVEAAFDSFYDLVLESGRTVGGRAAVIETAVAEGVLPMFADPPGCAMYKQADFAVGWMPDGTTIGPDGDVDFFVLPPEEADEAAPLIVGGDQAVQFNRSDEIDAVMEYLSTAAAGEIWARQGGFLSPHPDVEENAYPEELLQSLSTIVAGRPLALDASDQMPTAIGAGLFWQRITEWISGLVDYDQLAADLDAARDATGTNDDG